MNSFGKAFAFLLCAALVVVGAWFVMTDTAPVAVATETMGSAAESARSNQGAVAQIASSPAVSENPIAGQGTAATTPSQAKPEEVLIRGINWAKYPGTLGSQVRVALENKDAQMSFFLAERISDCITYVALPEELSRRNLSGGLGSSAEDGRMKSLCQSIEGDWREASSKLYTLAVDGEIRGASAAMFRNTGRLPPTGSKQITADASSGHLWSAITLAAVPPTILGVSKDAGLIAQHAIKLASAQVDAKRREQWLDAVKQISKGWADAAPLEQRTLSAEELSRAEAMAIKIAMAAKKGDV